MLIAFAVLPFFSTLLEGTAAIRLRHRLHPLLVVLSGAGAALVLAIRTILG